MIFSGDCANPIMVLRKRGCEKDEELVVRWLEKLRYVDSQINDETLICAGHGMLQREVWKQLIEAAEGPEFFKQREEGYISLMITLLSGKTFRLCWDKEEMC